MNKTIALRVASSLLAASLWSVATAASAQNEPGTPIQELPKAETSASYLQQTGNPSLNQIIETTPVETLLQNGISAPDDGEIGILEFNWELPARTPLKDVGLTSPYFEPDGQPNLNREGVGVIFRIAPASKVE
ncbi:MAG TPA: hypothetical protein IGS52_19205 [Oscillatoriaceae cyanobacterium M33_DOE_052]|uniref:Uncharacterized protein n=1 Tax=Planktothricoides sp. SpSt-374 TaxID=2282167 RepID=A0A7C3ZJF7_9CYAN|nr:hypothetical protein [Oscillatoriaceae cyanobacterium M33_DOE_052]